MINYINNLKKELEIVKNKIHTEENKYKSINYEKVEETLMTSKNDGNEKKLKIQKEVV